MTGKINYYINSVDNLCVMRSGQIKLYSGFCVSMKFTNFESRSVWGGCAEWGSTLDCRSTGGDMEPAHGACFI